MKIIEFLRKPYLSMVMATVILFVSCEQYDAPEVGSINKFEYSVFNEFKSNSVYLELINEMKQENLNNKSNLISVLQSNQNILYKVNSRLGTDIELPDSVLGIENASAEKVFEMSLSNRWITENNLRLIKEFNNDMKLIGFDKAIVNYEEKTLLLNLNKDEFVFNNNFVNMIKGLNYVNPDVFKSEMLSKSLKKSTWWNCAASIVALTAATLSLGSCLTIVVCGIALICVYAASRSAGANC